MLCSKCSQPLKPVVAIDIDGSLGDYHGHFTSFAESYLGRALPEDYRGRQEFSEYLGLEKNVYRDIKLAYRQGGLKRSMPVFDGAATFVQKLWQSEIEIWLNTTRPYLRLDNIDPDTRAWLDRNRIPYDGLIYDTVKYERLVEIVDPDRIVAAVDDLWDQCYTAERNFDLWAIQPEWSHNRDERWHRTFRNFDNLTEVILSRVEKWREINEDDSGTVG